MAENNNFNNKFYLNRFEKELVNMQTPRKSKSKDDKMKISGHSQSNKTTSSQKSKQSSWGRDSGARDLDFPGSPENTFEAEEHGVSVGLLLTNFL
jgi:hypothetical protein